MTDLEATILRRLKTLEECWRFKEDPRRVPQYKHVSIVMDLLRFYLNELDNYFFEYRFKPDGYQIRGLLDAVTALAGVLERFERVEIKTIPLEEMEDE